MKLTDRTVATLTCPPGRKDAMLFDGEMPGFGRRVTEQGKRLFLFQYRVGTKVRRARLGQWGKDGEGLTATQARKLASVQLGLVAAGADPVGDRKMKMLADADAEVAAKRKRKADAYTFRALINE